MKSIVNMCIALVVCSVAHAQTAPGNSQLQKLYVSYLDVKNALVNGNQQSAQHAAVAFSKNLNGISYQHISEGNVGILHHNAAAIAQAKNLADQRMAFAAFSENMITIAKALKLSAQPLYIQYCPMKKASWLSTERRIENPYYGSQMLNCGNIADSLPASGTPHTTH